MTKDKTMLSARVPTELKDMVDADPRTNQEVVEAALWGEFGGPRLSALERQKEELLRRRQQLEHERNERDREIDRVDNELSKVTAKIEKQRDKQERKEQRLDDVADILEGVPLDPDNPAVQTQAKKLDLTPDELITKLQDHA